MASQNEKVMFSQVDQNRAVLGAGDQAGTTSFVEMDVGAERGSICSVVEDRQSEEVMEEKKNVLQQQFVRETEREETNTSRVEDGVNGMSSWRDNPE
jgi:hypothetical protein